MMQCSFEYYLFCINCDLGILHDVFFITQHQSKIIAIQILTSAHEKSCSHPHTISVAMR